MKVDNRYTKLVQWVFDKYYHPGARKVEFPRSALEDGDGMLKIRTQRHYCLVPSESLSEEDLARYRQLSES